MRIPTVRLRNPRTGKKITVNQHEWAQDLGRGKWRGWTLDGAEKRGDTGWEKEQVIHDPTAFSDQPEWEVKTEPEVEAEVEAVIEEPETEDVTDSEVENEEDEKPTRRRGRPPKTEE